MRQRPQQVFLQEGIAMPPLETRRLTIRPFELNDAAFILRLLNEPSFIANIADKGVRDIEGAQRYLLEGPLESYRRHGFGLYRIGLKEQDTPIGMAGLLKRDYLADIDLGYALLPEFCGCGYAQEAAAAVLAFARESLAVERFCAIVNESNLSSIKLLGKLGFAASGSVCPPGTTEELKLFVTKRSAPDSRTTLKH
jgi:RimJ/RimL family protein N-acetyltransferase